MRLKQMTIACFIAIMLGLIALPGSAQNQKADDKSAQWKPVQDAMGRPGTMQPDGTFKFGMPRKDMKVTVNGTAVQPGLALGSWTAFAGTPDHAMVMGDLVLSEDEVEPVMLKLQQEGIHETAVHNHLLHETPRVMYMHIESHGNAVEMAKAIHDALALTKTPAADTAPAPQGEQFAYLLCVVLVIVAVSAHGQVPSIVASRTAEHITLDGRLDETAWSKAPVVTLTQQSPRPRQRNPYKTEVRVLASKDALYFGFVCHDPKPNAIAIHTQRRDGDQTGDDYVAIVLDSYGDRRTGYYFQINATGARVDGLIDNSESLSLDWDGIWDARTARTGDGWSAEIEIPTRTLSFTRGLSRWGLNIERFIPRERMTLRWSSPTLDAFLYDLSRAGELCGVGELEQGKGIEVSPYVTGKTTYVVSHRALLPLSR